MWNHRHRWSRSPTTSWILWSPAESAQCENHRTAENVLPGLLLSACAPVSASAFPAEGSGGRRGIARRRHSPLENEKMHMACNLQTHACCCQQRTSLHGHLPWMPCEPLGPAPSPFLRPCCYYGRIRPCCQLWSSRGEQPGLLLLRHDGSAQQAGIGSPGQHDPPRRHLPNYFDACVLMGQPQLQQG